MNRAHALFCRDCGCDMGYGWQTAPLCNQCGQLSLLPADCTCKKDDRGRVTEWVATCTFHTHDPYDIPF